MIGSPSRQHAGLYTSEKAARDYVEKINNPNVTITIEPITAYNIWIERKTNVNTFENN